MKLTELFDDLTSGELRQVWVGQTDVCSGMDPCYYPQALSYIQLGLTYLHTQFKLREGIVKVNLIPGVDSYVLDANYLVGSGSPMPVKYLESVGIPFTNNVLKVERVAGYVHREQMSLNTFGDPYSIRTPGNNVLYIPQKPPQVGVKPETALSVFYRANHPEIDKEMAKTAPDLINIELPEAYRQALILYVATKQFATIGASEGFHEGNNYVMKFTAEINRLEQLNLQSDWDYSPKNIRDQGWV